jgi:hypothetical protein
MAEYVLGAFEIGNALASNFAEVLSIIKGRSIVSAADWGNDRFEFGLSGNLQLRFFRTEDGMTVNLISTQNKGENPSLIIDLGDMDQRIPIEVIEKKINGLRTLYAAFYLIYDNRHKELQQYLLENPTGDFYLDLLHKDESLYIESISYGSWVVTVWSGTKKAYKSIVSVAGIAFERGREAFLSKLEADARFKNAQADKEEILVKKEDFELKKSQIDYLLVVSEKMDIPEVKEQLRERLIEATRNFTLGDKSDKDSYKKLK